VHGPVYAGGRSVLSAGPPVSAGSAAPWQPVDSAAPPAEMWTVSLPAVRTAPHRARHGIRAVLAEWGIPEEDCAVPELLASELVTNAVLFGEGLGSQAARHITVTLWRMPESLVIEVSDESPVLPDMQAPDTDREGGRGLVLVAGLSLDWGCYAVVPGGKTVYCVTRLPGRAAPAPLEDGEA
jgi:anti-sigma regulatory factor (Ser/Thr protein kinase)